jgi:hypothetical protein
MEVESATHVAESSIANGLAERSGESRDRSNDHLPRHDDIASSQLFSVRPAIASMTPSDEIVNSLCERWGAFCTFLQRKYTDHLGHIRSWYEKMHGNVKRCRHARFLTWRLMLPINVSGRQRTSPVRSVNE